MTPDRWLVLTVRVPSAELTEELAEGLVALGGAAVEEAGDRLTTYIAEPADPDAFLRGAADRLAGPAGEAPALDWRWQRDEDWSRRWKEGLEPRTVGRRLVVTQPWNPVEPSDAATIVLTVDPGTAFGTGEHPTTRGALRLLERAVRGDERVLDIGTGSGILALAAVGLGAWRVLAVESDADALGNARENIDRARAADRIELAHAVVDDAYLADAAGARGFDLITANVLSTVLIPLCPALAAALVPGGAVILGGIMESESATVLDVAGDAGLALEAEDREADWWTGLLRASPS